MPENLQVICSINVSTIYQFLWNVQKKLTHNNDVETTHDAR